MRSNEQTNKQNRNRLIDTDNRLKLSEGRRMRDFLKKVKGLRKKTSWTQTKCGDYKREKDVGVGRRG